MFRASSASSKTLRFCVLGLATIATAVLFTIDTADARKRTRHRQVRTVSYSPPFASIIVDGNSGATLQSNNADSPRHPASLTKIMTLYLLFERLENGKLKLDSEMDVSEHAASQSPTKLGLRPGQGLRVEDAIKGLVTRSANDAAVVISEAISGDEDDFAKLMTRKARSLGMHKTTYKNASGLPDLDQITTARDQALLGRAIQDRFPRYYRYFATNAFNYRGRTIRNHNRLLGSVEGVDGIKTGYTRASGFNLVTSMKRGNRHLVGVVLGGRSGGARDATMRSLLAENLERGANRRTIAAISERGDTQFASAADDGPDDTVEAKTTRAAPPAMVQINGAIQPAGYAAEPSPPPAPRAPVAASRPPASVADETSARIPPAPLTSGVVSSQPLSIIPGSSDPMTPVRIKTVQIKGSGAKLASAGPSQPIAIPTATASISSRTAETSNAVVGRADLPPVNPRHGTGQGILGTMPATGLQNSGAMAYADPASRSPSPAPQIIQQNGAIKAVTRTGWIIQVGALESEAEARSRLDSARDSARSLLGRAEPFTEAVAKSGKSLYRARFAGLDKDQAEAACKMLKRNEISCIAIKN